MLDANPEKRTQLYYNDWKHSMYANVQGNIINQLLQSVFVSRVQLSTCRQKSAHNLGMIE